MVSIYDKIALVKYVNSHFERLYEKDSKLCIAVIVTAFR